MRAAPAKVNKNREVTTIELTGQVSNVYFACCVMDGLYVLETEYINIYVHI